MLKTIWAILAICLTMLLSLSGIFAMQAGDHFDAALYLAAALWLFIPAVGWPDSTPVAELRRQLVAAGNENANLKVRLDTVHAEKAAAAAERDRYAADNIALRREAIVSRLATKPPAPQYKWDELRRPVDPLGHRWSDEFQVKPREEQP